jgi:hypothetical protein
VPDYGVDLPEINSSAPISLPSYFPAMYVVNWIERGLHIQFEEIEEEVKLYYFLLEWNAYARATNEQAGKAELPLTPGTLSYMAKQLKYHKGIEERTEDSLNPFKRDMKPNTHTATGEKSIGRTYTNKTVTERFKKKSDSKPGPQPTGPKPLDDVRLFDMFDKPPDAGMLTDDGLSSGYRDLDFSN